MTRMNAVAAAQKLGLYGVLIVFALLFVAPLLVVSLNSVRDVQDIMGTSVVGWPRAFDFQNWPVAWDQFCVNGHCSGIRPYIVNSLLIAGPATIISTLLGALNGYSLALWRFRGDTWVFGVIVAGIFLPDQMKLIPWTLILSYLKLRGSLAGLVLIHSIQGISFTTLFCRNYYTAIPRELMRAATMDGAGFLQTFVHVVLPLSPPILIVTVIWQFTSMWNEFVYGITFTSGEHQPVTAALLALTSQIAEAPQYGVQAAAVLLAAMPTLLIYVFAGRFFVRGLTAGAVK
jgi:glucose/mannose transport system permease protein